MKLLPGDNDKLFSGVSQESLTVLPVKVVRSGISKRKLENSLAHSLIIPNSKQGSNMFDTELPCSMCGNDINNNELHHLSSCLHSFHKACLKKALLKDHPKRVEKQLKLNKNSGECPSCRKLIAEKELNSIMEY